jgi:hypothetical protein
MLPTQMSKIWAAGAQKPQLQQCVLGAQPVLTHKHHSGDEQQQASIVLVLEYITPTHVQRVPIEGVLFCILV